MTIEEGVRWRAVETYLEGEESLAKTAERFRISPASLKRWLKLYRETGKYMTGKVSEGRPRSYTSEDEEAILKQF